MEFGVVFPTCEIGDDPVAIRDFAQAAEGLGYSQLMVFDHILATPHEDRASALLGPYTERDPFHEPFMLLSFLAGLTTTLDFMTGVMVLPQRQTALVAKQAAELSILSGGRFTLGVGTGWNHVEYEALNVEFADRGELLTEQVKLLRELWREPLVNFSGNFHHVDRAGLNPRPTSPIPIWFGGVLPVSLRRTAAIGDGYISGSPGYDHVGQLLQFLAEAGRDQTDFGLCEILGYSNGPEAWGAEVVAWEKFGGTHLCVCTQAPGTGIRGDAPVAFETVDGHISAMETFIREIGPT